MLSISTANKILNYLIANHRPNEESSFVIADVMKTLELKYFLLVEGMQWNERLGVITIQKLRPDVIVFVLHYEAHDVFLRGGFKSSDFEETNV